MPNESLGPDAIARIDEVLRADLQTARVLHAQLVPRGTSEETAVYLRARDACVTGRADAGQVERVAVAEALADIIGRQQDHRA